MQLPKKWNKENNILKEVGRMMAQHNKGALTRCARKEANQSCQEEQKNQKHGRQFAVAVVAEAGIVYRMVAAKQQLEKHKQQEAK